MKSQFFDLIKQACQKCHRIKPNHKISSGKYHSFLTHIPRAPTVGAIYPRRGTACGALRIMRADIAAFLAAQGKAVLLQPKMGGAFGVLGGNMVVTTNTESMVK
jgi:hypothetical protein